MHYLIGQLIGDYVLQTDWMANNKTKANRGWMGLLIASFHSLLVTLAIFLCAAWATKTWTFWAPWKLAVIFITHTLQDWARAPRLWMELVGQFTHFRETKELFPAYLWAIFVIDNVWYLALLFFLANI